jgi:hypothetical protein
MTEDTKEKIELEIEMLQKLLAEYSPLLDLIKIKTPDIIEATAMGSVMHSFYNGVENIFKVILKGYNEKISAAGNWHIELLNKVVQISEKRNKLISEALQIKLMEYLKFRHTFRHIYGFQISWDKMEHLALQMETVLSEFLAEINAFIKNN